MRRLSDERGSALIVAMVVMGLLLTASLGTLEFIDRSQHRTGHERIRETSGVLRTETQVVLSTLFERPVTNGRVTPKGRR